MPTFKHGDMWDSYDDVNMFCITTNNAIKKNGALVMGRGIAKEAKDRFPGLDLRLGSLITHHGDNQRTLLR